MRRKKPGKITDLGSTTYWGLFFLRLFVLLGIFSFTRLLLNKQHRAQSTNCQLNLRRTKTVKQKRNSTLVHIKNHSENVYQFP